MGMRVLFTTPVGLGHIHPNVPLAQAAAARGHDVLWAVPPDGVPHVEQAGLRAVAAGSPTKVYPGDVLAQFPELANLAREEIPDAMFPKLFGAIHAPRFLADLIPIATEWRPDLVVADAAEFAGHIVAAELGVPSVTKAFGALLPERRVAAAGDEVAPLWRSRGLEPRPFGGAYDRLYIDIYPPLLQPEVPPHVPERQHLRPVAYDGGFDVPSPLPLPEARPAPLVYVTMGTVFNQPEPLRVAVEAIQALGVTTLVTVGPNGDPATLGGVPDHVRVERYVPQTAVLPRADLVVSHAGSGTVLAALGLGVPQLCLPQGADQFTNAAAVASAGAGISIPPSEASVEAIAEAAGRLLEDGSFRQSAGAVAESIGAMPSPDEVVEVLEGIA